MKRWFIEVINTATDRNTGFKPGTKHEFWYGRNEKLLANFNYEELRTNQPALPYLVREYGFKTQAGATKAYQHHLDISQNGNGYGVWNKEVRIAEVEV